jgi:hypothetical protein
MKQKARGLFESLSHCAMSTISSGAGVAIKADTDVPGGAYLVTPSEAVAEEDPVEAEMRALAEEFAADEVNRRSQREKATKVQAVTRGGLSRISKSKTKSAPVVAVTLVEPSCTVRIHHDAETDEAKVEVRPTGAEPAAPEVDAAAESPREAARDTPAALDLPAALHGGPFARSVAQERVKLNSGQAEAAARPRTLRPATAAAATGRWQAENAVAMAALRAEGLRLQQSLRGFGHAAHPHATELHGHIRGLVRQFSALHLLLESSAQSVADDATGAAAEPSLSFAEVSVSLAERISSHAAEAAAATAHDAHPSSKHEWLLAQAAAHSLGMAKRSSVVDERMARIRRAHSELCEASRGSGEREQLTVEGLRDLEQVMARVAEAPLPAPIKAQILANLECLSHDAERLLTEADPQRRASARKALALRFAVLEDHNFWTHALPPKALGYLKAH